MKKVLPTLVILILLGVLGTMFYKEYWVKYSYSSAVGISRKEDRRPLLSRPCNGKGADQ